MATLEMRGRGRAQR